jgi:prevent-host-death family protein
MSCGWKRNHSAGLVTYRSCPTITRNGSRTRASHDMVMNMVTKRANAVPSQISAAEFKATCLDLMDEVDRTGAAIVITKRGRAVAQLAPIRTRVRSAFGLLKGQIVVRGNIIDPIDVTWDAAK